MAARRADFTIEMRDSASDQITLLANFRIAKGAAD
jgi:hypothetical protein